MNNKSFEKRTLILMCPPMWLALGFREEVGVVNILTAGYIQQTNHAAPQQP
jgi:hypothetical protein